MKDEIGTGTFGYKILRGTYSLDPVLIKVLPKGTGKYLEEVKYVQQHHRLERIIGFMDSKLGDMVITPLYNQNLSEALPSLTWKERRRVAIHAAEGLHSLHMNGIVHMSCSSVNIMMNGDSIVWKDIGLMKCFDYKPYESFSVGMISYLAPEFFNGDGLVCPLPFSEKADIFAFGVVLAELLCNKKSCWYTPITGTRYLVQWFQERLMTAGSNISTIKELNPDAGKQMISIFSRVVVSIPADRISSKYILQELIEDRCMKCHEAEIATEFKKCGHSLYCEDCIFELLEENNHQVCCPLCLKTVCSYETLKLLEETDMTTIHEFLDTAIQNQSSSKILRKILLYMTELVSKQENNLAEFCHDILPSVKMIHHRFPESPEMQHTIFGVFKEFVSKSDCINILMEQGIPSLALDAMSASGVDIVMICCTIIAVLAETSVNNKIELMILGAGKIILDVMKRHSGIAELQSRAIQTISELAAYVPENQRKLMEMGVAEEVVTQMYQHRSIEVQVQGSSALWSLGMDNGNGKIQVLADKLRAHVAISQAMAAHPMHPVLQENCCGALLEIILYDSSKIVRHHLEDKILSAMDNHQTNPQVQYQACAALSNLCESGDEAILTMMKRKGFQDKIKRAMQLQDEDVQAQACGAIGNLGGSISNSEWLVTVFHAEDLILKAMNSFVGNVRVQENGCAALGLWLSFDSKKTNEILAGKNVAGIVVAAMAHHAEDTGLLTHACEVLACLAKGDPKIRVELSNKQAVKRIILALKRHKEHEDLHVAGFSVLVRMAPDGLQDELLDVVLATMEEFPDNLSLQMDAAKLVECFSIHTCSKELILEIQNVVRRCMGRKQKSIELLQSYLITLRTLAMLSEYPATSIEPTMIDMVLKTMDENHTDAEIQKYGCSIFSSLSVNHSNALMAQSVDDRIIKSMRLFVDIADLHISSLEAICNLLHKHAQVLIKKKILKRILKSFSKFSSNEHVQELAAHALGILSKEYSDEMKEKGVLKFVIRRMDTYIGNGDLQEHCCIVLANMAVRHTALLIAEGAHFRIFAAMEKHSKNTALLHLALDAISAFSQSSDENSLLMVENGADIQILNAMETHEEDAGLQEKACRTFQILAKNEINCSKISQNDAESRILKAADRHHGNEKLKNLARDFMTRIIGNSRSVQSYYNRNELYQKLVKVNDKPTPKRLLHFV